MAEEEKGFTAWPLELVRPTLTRTEAEDLSRKWLSSGREQKIGIFKLVATVAAEVSIRVDEVPK